MNNNYFHVNDFKVFRENFPFQYHYLISNQVTIPYFYGYLLHLKFTNISYETCKKEEFDFS